LDKVPNLSDIREDFRNVSLNMSNEQEDRVSRTRL